MVKKKILIFIITYKASFRVLEVFKKIPFNKINNFYVKTLLSDDCSKDDTMKFMKKIKKNYKNIILNENKKNIGYGAHIKKCLNYAINKNFNYAIMIHGDGQYSPTYIPQMIKLLDKKNIGAITGSRIKKGLKKVTKGGMPFYKLFGNLLLTKIFNLLLGASFTDAHTGYWLYNLSYLKNKNYNKLTNSFNFDQEFRFKCMHDKRDILEVPIHTRYGDERSQLHILYAIKFFFSTIYFFFIQKKILKNHKF